MVARCHGIYYLSAVFHKIIDLLQIMGKGARGTFVLSPEIFCIKWTVSCYSNIYLSMSENRTITYGTNASVSQNNFFIF
jgi:hypothetical protein